MILEQAKPCEGAHHLGYGSFAWLFYVVSYLAKVSLEKY